MKNIKICSIVKPKRRTVFYYNYVMTSGTINCMMHRNELEMLF